jgi:hypothetical protein
MHQQLQPNSRKVVLATGKIAFISILVRAGGEEKKHF